MSYTNGIGSAQQSGSAEAAAAAAAGTDKAAKTAASSAQALAQVLNGSGDASWSDQASLSKTGSALAQGFSASDVRGDKVAELQQAIAAGTYSVSSSDVANKLMKALLQ